MLLVAGLFSGTFIGLPSVVLMYLWNGRMVPAALFAALGLLASALWLAYRAGLSLERVTNVIGVFAVLVLVWLAGTSDLVVGHSAAFVTLLPALMLVLRGPRPAAAWTLVVVTALLGTSWAGPRLGHSVVFGPSGPLRAFLVTAVLLLSMFVLMSYLRRWSHLSFEEIQETHATSLSINADLQDAEAAAREASRMKSEFLAVMSHELRTPLNGVLGATDLLSSTGLDGEQERYVHTLSRSATSFLGVLKDALDLQRIEEGTLELRKGPVDLYAMVRELADLLRPRAVAKGIGLATTVDIGVPGRVLTDPVLVRQILTNLLGNALKFTDRGDVMIHVGARLAPGGALQVSMTVRDSGVGIATERLESIFGRFAQAEISTRRMFGGSGLGLAISQRCAAALDGSIEVTSVVGEGSAFTLSFPTVAVAAPPVRRPAPVAPVPVAPVRELSVLIAEDNPVNLMVAKRMLEIMGHTVASAGDGAKAVEMGLAGNYDLVLMDCELPVMDGIEATRRLRAAGFTTPIVALTAHALAELEEQAMEAGIDLWLTKPVTRDRLEAAIATVSTMASERV